MLEEENPKNNKKDTLANETETETEVLELRVVDEFSIGDMMG